MRLEMNIILYSLQELQTAVEKRNEIISQLSVNLQVALESRDQVQLEAMQLTSQMQDLQQQLQQASEFLRARSQSSVELSQAQQHISQFQHSLQDQSSQLGRLQQELVESRQHIKEQQYLLTQKETEIKDLQQKQDVTETALSQLQEALSVRDQELATLRNHEHTRETHTQTQDALLESLRAELQAEREVCLRERERVSQLEQLVRDFEMERREMKDQLAGVREELSMEARHCKEEEEELSQEVVRLDSLVWELQKQLQEEETASRHQRAKLEADISNYELRLRSLEEEKAMDLAQVTEAHEVELKRLRQEHEDEVWRLQQHQQDHKYQTSPEDTCMGESLEGVKVQEEHVSLETVNESQEEPGLDLSFHQDHLIEKYLTSVAPRDSTWGESSQEQSLLDNSGNYRFELDGKVELEAPKSVCSAQDAPAAAGDLMDMSFPSGRGSEVAEPGEESLTSGQWHTHISASQVLESLETVDLGKALLIQQCSDLTAQLEDRDRQLEKLQGQIHSTVEEVQEVSERWSKAEKALESVRWELEAEREQRLRCEEVISCKTHEGDNLKNKLSFLESQQEYQDKAGLPHSKPTDTLFHATADLIRDLREEKELLLGQLREQEQLVRDVQEKKLAGDSVTSDVQALFGRQLSALQTQRDGLQVQLEFLEVKNQTTSKLLEQKTLELDSTQKELQHLRAELEESKDRMQKIGKEKMDLESRLLCLKQNLANAEEALCQGAEEKTVQEERLGQIETLVKNTENTLQTEREAFLKQLQDLEAVSLEKESALEVELESVRKALSEQGTQHSKAIEEAEAQLRQAHQEICRLQGKHQDEVCDLTLEMEKKLLDLETEQKKQIALIKQVHEREHQRELAELASRHRDNLEAAHQEHLLQAQTQQALELEALRLSLNNLHAAQLELSQSNLQRDKEAALSELQSTLRDKWAQESAMLQTRQQFELEKIREQCRQQHQRELGEWARAIGGGGNGSAGQDLKLDWQKEAVKAQSELQATLMETLQALSTTKTQLEELQASRDQEVKHLEEELSQAWTDRDAAAKAVEELVSSHNILLQDQRGQAQHLEELRVASTLREQQLQQQLEKLQGEFAALKQSSEQEVTHLRTQLDCTRASRQELGELKEQLLARSSRVEEIERLKQEFSQQRKDIQEHNELELENLRTYFEQRLRATEENYREEIALLQLRLVEGALEDSVLKTGDASFMSEGKAEEKSDILAEITLKLEKHKEEVGALRVELEGRHKQELEHLRSSMALAYREELLQVKTDLTDRYFSQIQDLKTRHSLELEQQKAKLSESHVKELTRLRGQSVEEASVRVEQEVERARVLSEVLQAQLAQRVQDLEAEKAELVREHDTELKRVREEHCTILKQAQEKLKQDCEAELCLKVEEAQREERTNVTLELNQQGQTEMATLREELQRTASGERASLLQQLEVERERLRTLQEGLETEQSPQILVVKQKIQAQFENELQEARNAMAMEVKELKAKMEEQTEAKLQDTQSRFLDEKKQHEAAFEKLKQQHCEELHEHEERYKKQLNGLKMDLHLKHTAALEALKVDLQGKQRAQLDALEAELRGKHRAEMDALEVDLRGKHRADLDALERDLQGKHKAELDALQVVLQETNLAQLEAQEAELQARHKQEREELEARMLSNMDTLETTYLAEIQAIRDEGERALQELRESCERAQQVAENGHAAELERLHAENHAQLLSITEELRRELAQVHMDKFTAMAAELKNAHQAELTVALTSQCDALEMEHSRALQNLRQELLVMDEKHSASLQEVREQYSAEMQQGQEQMAMLKTQHQQQLQELSESSARNLEEEVSRQQLQFQEEAEKLLQQRVTQLKVREGPGEDGQQDLLHQGVKREDPLVRDSLCVGQLFRAQPYYPEEFAAEKAATLEECEQKAQVCRESVDQLNKQLQEKHAESSQLRAEVSNLQGVLEGKRSEMETLEMLLQRRERENQEGENLLTMLRADLSTASQERMVHLPLDRKN
ncbi:hypothetical protein JZ751_020032 [Albula glossodonta]|uniref:ELK domain-containing protein n=1 Tax=Albula glossodonta TaxID=121402 RepID=A0A8T2NNP8_9TELE|nr:hypothetical protein JZ751_020032 [Albula glossodonta]